MPYSRILHLFNTSNFLSDTELINAGCKQYTAPNGTAYTPAQLVPYTCVATNFLNQRPTAAQLTSTCGVTTLNAQTQYLVIQTIVSFLTDNPTMSLTGGQYGSLAALGAISNLDSCFNTQCVINTAPVAERPYLAPERNFVSARVCHGGQCTDTMPSADPTDTYGGAAALEGTLPTYSHAIGNLQEGDWVRVFVYSHNTAIQDLYTAQNVNITVGWTGALFNASIASPSATPTTTNATNTVSYSLGNGLALQAEGVLHRYFRPSFANNYYEETTPQVAVNPNSVIFGLGSHASSTANINFTYFDFQVISAAADQSYDLEKTADLTGWTDGVAQTDRNVTYTVTLTNNGNDPFVGTEPELVVTDTLNNNLTYRSGNAGVSHSGANPGGLVTLDFRTLVSAGNLLNSGETVSLSFVVRVNDGVAVGTNVCNTVTGTYDSDTICFPVPGTSYSIEKTAFPAGGSTVYQGEGIRYDVTITNTGATPLTTTVIDTYDPNTTLVAETPDNPNTIDYGNGTVGLLFENVPPGVTQTLSFFVTVNANAPAGQICNSVTDTNGNVSTVCHTVVEIPVDLNFVINKTAATPCYVDGGTVQFSIEVGNEGPGELNSIVITDPFDTNIAVTSATDVTMISGHTNWTVTPFINPTTGNIDYYQLIVNDVGGDGILDEGEYDTITFSVPVANPVTPDGVAIGNMAWGEAWGVGVRDMLVQNSSNLVTILPCGSGDFTVEKIGEIFNYNTGQWVPSIVPGNPTVYRGDLIRYTITVNNTLGSSQTIAITDNLPVNAAGDPLVTYMPPTTPPNVIANYNVGPPHTVDIIFSNVPANTSQSFTFYVEVIADAVLNPDNSTFCNNIDGVTPVCSEVFGDVDPLFVITKTNNPTDCVTPNGTITYTITVRNDHPVGNLTNIVVYDDLDNNVTGSSNPVILNFADLAPGETSAPQTITVTVNAGTPAGTILSNVANGTATWNGQVVNHSNIVYNTVQAICNEGGDGDDDGDGSGDILLTAGICALINQGTHEGEVTCQKIEISENSAANNTLWVLHDNGMPPSTLYPEGISLAELDAIKTAAQQAATACENLTESEKRACVQNWLGQYMGAIMCGYPSLMQEDVVLDPTPTLENFGNLFEWNSSIQDQSVINILAAQCGAFKPLPTIDCVAPSFTTHITKNIVDSETGMLADHVYAPNNQAIEYQIDLGLEGFFPPNIGANMEPVRVESADVILYDYTVPADSVNYVWDRYLDNNQGWIANQTDGRQLMKSLSNEEIAVLNDAQIWSDTFNYQITDPKLAIRADQGDLMNVAFAVITLNLEYLETIYDPSTGAVIGTAPHFEEVSYGIGKNGAELLCIDGIPLGVSSISSEADTAMATIIRPYLTTMGGSNLGLYETTTSNNENLFGKIGERTQEEGFFGGEDTSDLFGIGTLQDINNGNGKSFIENLKKSATESASILGKTWNTTADEMGIYFITNDIIISSDFIKQGKGESVKTLVIDGNLTLNSNIELADDQFVAFVVSGDITIGKDVTALDGIYISSGDIKSDGQTSKKQLVVKGSLVGKIEDLAKNRIYIGDPKNNDGVPSPNIVLSYDLRVLELTPSAIEQFLGEGWGQEGQ
jgi:fimbrial isopeptide formation D2 family protein